MNKSFLLLIALMILSFGFIAPKERTITGKVTSAEDSRALPGVNVVVKGTSQGTVTDAQGNYLLKIPSHGKTLVFSFIGLKTLEVLIGTQNRMDAVMQVDASELSEVVVTGYGSAS